MKIIVCIFLLLICIVFIANIIQIQMIKKLINQNNKNNQVNVVKLDELIRQSNSFNGFMVSTYNNSIRIAKKLGIYFSINREDYENHQQKTKDKSLTNQ